MIRFFRGNANKIYAVGLSTSLSQADTDKLSWLFGGAEALSEAHLSGTYIGPRKEMITPWSTNAVEITQNMGISGILRIEEFFPEEAVAATFDPMLQARYEGLDEQVFLIVHAPEPIKAITDIAAYNASEGLALSQEEIDYLQGVADELGRPLTDSEVFGFSQVNSEHCRHKIFNGTFVIDGEEQPHSLFKLIKKTSEAHPNRLVSAYKDNVAFTQGPVAEQFAPATQDKPDFFKAKPVEMVLSLKAETHNFPTTVEPFYGASTGSGGEIRDRLAGGKGSSPLAGTAVYMTSYSRLEAEREWEKAFPARKWLYQTPMDILIKASNGASDFGNKFGQPLICGSVLTFEHQEGPKAWGYDKVIMLAGGIGYGKKSDSLKDTPGMGDKVVVMGGDNYRIGMGGGAVSSVATGEFGNSIELNAVQRANPEMQKRVANAIRAMAESDVNPIVSIHDHGAGGHLNCLSELVEDTGGAIDLEKLPVGDPTLSAKEIIGNESQERMGLVMKEADIDLLRRVSERERAPLYVVGDITGDMQFTFADSQGRAPINWKLDYLFGSSPKTIMDDKREKVNFGGLEYEPGLLYDYLEQVLQLEAVACKDWLTNKVDRSVTGRVALQQTCGPVQLPLNNLGISALDYRGEKGIATSIGHAPVPALIDPAAGSVLAIAESLSNIIWAPIEGGITGISLSANWMWPCNNPGEDARLYEAVQAVSDFAIALGINIPTGKDSLSMKQKYPDGKEVLSPGTVIISAMGEVSDIRKAVSPSLVPDGQTEVLHVDLSGMALTLGGSSFAQVINQLGDAAPTVADSDYFSKAFNAVQELVKQDLVLAGHDISSGGLITALLELCFTVPDWGLSLDLSSLGDEDLIKTLFAENPGLLLQVTADGKAKQALDAAGIGYTVLGTPVQKRNLHINYQGNSFDFAIDDLRDTWFRSSYLLDRKQTKPELAESRFREYKNQALSYTLPEHFSGSFASLGISPDRPASTGKRAAIIREKGVNGDREMAYSLWLAGFDVKDVHMTDLISGREMLEDVQMIVFVGGFSNSDVLGSAKGWAGAFLYNPKAKEALDKFYARPDTLSLGVCNGCQLMIELGLVTPEHAEKPVMEHNESGKFESIFLTVDIAENNSVMLKSLSGSRLGVWVAHGEGKFKLPYAEDKYQIVAKYSHSAYPANPNGSDFDTAFICSEDGRHLAMMPHIERSIFPWHWPWYPQGKGQDVSPWMEAFVNARKWVEAQG